MNDPPRFLVYTDSLAYRNTLEDLLQHSRAGIFHDWEAFAQAVGRGERAVAFVIQK